MTIKTYTQILSTKDFITQYKKADIKIRKAFDKQFALFATNPMDLSLHNHPLRKEWVGHRSIAVTADWRAIYKEIHEGKAHIAYFVTIGTHKQLYK
jgi:addiction module RelE/StbE family toxin